MDVSAQEKQILITNIGTSLGSSLALELIKSGWKVFGVGKKQPAEDLLESPNFTFLDIDLTQPLPQHLPKLKKIIHIVSESKLSSASKMLISKAQEGDAALYLIVSVDDAEEILTSLDTQNIMLLAVGHLYGPDMNDANNASHSTNPFDNNELTNIINQAVKTDKIILENDGANLIYPTYKSDATGAILREISSGSSTKAVKFITTSPAQSSLSLSYEIQSKARLILNKELNLFFKGPESFEKLRSKPEIKINHLHLDKRHSFQEGIENTLLAFKDKGSAKNLDIKASDQEVILQTFSGGRTPFEEKKQKIKFPMKLKHLPTGNGKMKRAVGSALILLSLIFTFTTYNLLMGASDLKAAKKSLESANFEAAKEKSQNASKHFSSATKSSYFILLPISFTSQAKSFKSGIEGLKIGSSALSSFVSGAELLSHNLEAITSANQSKTQLDLETPVAFLTKSYFDSQHATSLVEKAQSAIFLKSQFKDAYVALTSLEGLSQAAKEITVLTPDITGANTQKTYLVLLMNNAELRPGGGFIGNFAEISFDNNKLEEIKVEDIYTIDGQLKEIIEPPPVMTQKLGVTQLFLRDSNLSTDFRVNADVARDFYKKETGKTVDGVIAMDLTFLENLLSRIGPLKIEDYDEEITHENLLERGQYYSEVGFFPGSTQKRDFFSALTKSLISKMFESFSHGNSQVGQASWLALFEVANKGLQEKHLMMSFDNTNLNALVKAKNWDNPMPPSHYNPVDDEHSTRDFLALSEANIGANKVNRFLKREIAYDMTIGRDADLMATLTLKYTNESPADTWPGGTYVNYLRFFTPKNSTLETFKVDGKEVEINQLLRGQPTSVIETTQVGELTQFTTLIEVPVKQVKTFEFKYRIHKNIKLETAPKYELYTSKQPGTLSDPFKFTFNLPGYLSVESINGSKENTGKQNIGADSNLTVDRHFEIEVKRK